MSVRIIECTDPTELYRHYDGQSEPQDAYLELDTQDGTLHADYNSEIGNAVPFTVHHGLQRRYSIPILTADAANRVMEEIRPFAERIVAGTESEWDGNNTVAVLDDDARAAEEELEDRLGLPSEGNGYSGQSNQGFNESDLVAVWDIEGATNGCEVDEYDITPDTLDSRLDEIEQEILSSLADCGDSPVVVCHGLDDYLRELRDDLASEDPLNGAEVRVVREQLGLTGDHLAKKLGVNPRTVRSWEQERDAVPGPFRPDIAQMKADTDQAVADAVASWEAGDEDALYVYRNDDDFDAARKAGRHKYWGWSASWHRQVIARAAAQTGARIEYADMGADEE